MVNAKRVGQINGLARCKRRLPRAPKELSVIESGGSTRPVPLFYNGVNYLHLGAQFAMLVETNRQKVTGSRVQLSTGNCPAGQIVTLVIISTSHLPLNSIPPPCKLPREDMPPKGGTIASYAQFETGG